MIWPASDNGPLMLPPDTHAKLFKITGAQLVTDTGIGAMKSLISDVKLSEERLFKYACPKFTHTPDWKMPVVCRSMDASPKVSASSIRTGLAPAR